MGPGKALTPEDQAREEIDRLLVQAGWIVQDKADRNVHAGQGVAVTYVQMASGHGEADYLLFVDGQAVGVVEAKRVGHTISGVEIQTAKYADGLPKELAPPVRPLPFIYLSTGKQTAFINLLDPKAKTREVFSFHRPETLAEWLGAPKRHETGAAVLAEGEGAATADYPATLRARLQGMPEVDAEGLRPNQFRGICNLEQSMRLDRPRALIQMATGSGKTRFAVTSMYRLIKHAGARRVLFLVDRSNLGEQAEKEFEGYKTQDDNRQFTSLYNVHRLTTNTIGSSAKVVITTIQRMYSMLKGEPEFDPEREEESGFEFSGAAIKEPLPVVYNETYPPEYFDVIFVDECHRSIYTIWRQVLEYFDAFLIGLTATPASHTYGFFQKNLVMEYGHREAVADGVNVDFDVYKIRTRVGEEGATVEAADDIQLGYRDLKTQTVRWETPDEDLTYDPNELDRRVYTPDQIRTVIRTFRDRLFTEIFPGRTIVPKTLIFAKTDRHAEDIVEIVRHEFGQGNDFCQKITYKTTGAKPKDLITAFRNRYDPRIAVTVDMIATGTDVKPIEIVMFMRAVRSRVLFEQMKGRGVRVIDPDELQAVSSDAKAKDRFVLIDCVGVCDTDLVDTSPLDTKKSVSFKAILEHVELGGTDPDHLSSLAGRLARMAQKCDAEDVKRIKDASGGQDLFDISRQIVGALDADAHVARAREQHHVPEGEQPSDAQVEQAQKEMLGEASLVLASRPKLREVLMEVRDRRYQIIDNHTIDHETFAGPSEDSTEKAKQITKSFREYLDTHKDEIAALEFFYSVPHRRRLTSEDIEELAQAIELPPRGWTPERLWKAYETLDAGRVRAPSAGRRLEDIVSLVRFALEQDQELRPFEDQVRLNFDRWLSQQCQAGREFTEEQRRWLEMIRDHVATSIEMTIDDFDLAPFAEEGGLGRAGKVFGQGLGALLRDLNEALAA